MWWNGQCIIQIPWLTFTKVLYKNNVADLKNILTPTLCCHSEKSKLSLLVVLERSITSGLTVSNVADGRVVATLREVEDCDSGLSGFCFFFPEERVLFQCTIVQL